jgi:hypothetical protein
MSDELPWPRKGDQLFAEDDDWWNNACVGWSRDEWTAYGEGYKRAAEILVQHVVDTQRDQDFLIFPIGFLYRQYLEVRLKHLLRDGFLLLDVREAFPTHHRLNELWKGCRRVLEQVWPDGPRDDLDAVEEVIEQFKQKDPGSTAFRYPVDTKGNRSLPTTERINLRNLAEVMERTAALLDACSAGIQEDLQQKWEMEQGYSY